MVKNFWFGGNFLFFGYGCHPIFPGQNHPAPHSKSHRSKSPRFTFELESYFKVTIVFFDADSDKNNENFLISIFQLVLGHLLTILDPYRSLIWPKWA